VLRTLRWAALALGFPLLVALVLGAVLLGLRIAQVKWLPSVSEPERLEAKQRYLDALEPVDRERVPNFVVIFFDDLGWGDLSVQGSQLIDTPRIDRAAEQGLRLTSFYSASSVCTPSRASLLTGRYPPRAGVSRHVYFPDEMWIGLARRVAGWGNELPRDEILLPEALGAAGYATGMVGKWHLGGRDGHRPTELGFDTWFGVLWSNDMVPLDLYRGSEVIERDERDGGLGERDEERPLGPGGVDQTRLTQRYTEEAIAFMRAQRERPFFLYVAHSFPHVPHYPSREHAGQSDGGRYGDVVEDLDRSTGAILDAIEQLGLAEETLVLITSDNGADYGGSPGGLRGRKGEILEGGQRVPLIVHWPGRVPAGAVSDAIAMNIDVFPTLLSLAGLPLPQDRAIDGRDLTSLLMGGAESPHERLFYFPVFGSLPEAVRDDRFKLLRSTGDPGRDRPHLTRLDADIEAHDLRAKHPAVAARLEAALAAKREEFETNPRGWR
jgi:arylsulfatase A-like enzyme